jgi:hypothetical protein
LGKTDVQALGSAITYTRRYVIVSIFNLIIDDDSDDDGNAANDGSTKRKWHPDLATDKMFEAISVQLPRDGDVGVFLEKFYYISQRDKSSVSQLYASFLDAKTNK